MNDPRAELERLAKTFAAESPLEHEGAKASMAEVAAALVVRHNQLTKLDLAGLALDAEVARTLPAIASNVKRFMEALGLTYAGKKQKKKAAGFLKTE